MDASGVETVSGILRLTSIIRRILADCDDDVHLYFQEFNGNDFVQLWRSYNCYDDDD